MDIVSSAEQYIIQLFKDKLSSSYSYHNLDHTQRVVEAVVTMCDAENVLEKDKEVLLLAAWFHDSGYCDSCNTHEKIGMQLADKFLTDQHYPLEDIARVKSLINSTSINYNPQNHLENIIKDADTSHLGSPDFFEISDALRKEINKINNQKISKTDWLNLNLIFLSKHRFYTDFAQENWNHEKEKIQKKIKKQIEKNIKEESEKEKYEEDKILLNQKKIEKLDSPGRGVDTMFRVTMNNHMHLSQIADSKANILLSVNAIIVSVLLSTIVPKLDSPNNAHLIIPTFILIGFSVASVIMAIVSTRPQVSSGTFTRNDIENKKINLLFFGNFNKVSLEDYTWAMNEMMTEKAFLYDSIIKDLYYLGKVLDRKYRLLRTTYTIFTIGILVSVVAYFVAFQSIM
jgi:predicted metal-dependent HD superfamily phosphohydrolase